MPGKYLGNYMMDYSNEDEFTQEPGTGYLGYDTTPAQTKASLSSGADSEMAGADTAAAAASGNPYVAGATIGGKFLTSYMAMRAKEEADRMAALQGAYARQGQATNEALNQRLAAYARALR